MANNGTEKKYPFSVINEDLTFDHSDKVTTIVDFEGLENFNAGENVDFRANGKQLMKVRVQYQMPPEQGGQTRIQTVYIEPVTVYNESLKAWEDKTKEYYTDLKHKHESQLKGFFKKQEVEKYVYENTDYLGGVAYNEKTKRLERYKDENFDNEYTRLKMISTRKEQAQKLQKESFERKLQDNVNNSRTVSNDNPKDWAQVLYQNDPANRNNSPQKRSEGPVR